jgi:pimeloyl-ACP methyl ester carboxylesterase
MPYANNNGVKIYYEVEGQGPPLVLAHGGTDGGSGWRTIFKPEFKKVRVYLD